MADYSYLSGRLLSPCCIALVAAPQCAHSPSGCCMNPASLFSNMSRLPTQAGMAEAARARERSRASPSPQHSHQHQQPHPPMQPPSADQIEAELASFNLLLSELSSPHASPPSHREQLLFNFFTQLRNSSPTAQIQGLDLLASLLERKPSVILGCNNLLTLIVRPIARCRMLLWFS
jgi:hypothetical protein